MAQITAILTINTFIGTSAASALLNKEPLLYKDAQNVCMQKVTNSLHLVTKEADNLSLT